jgi:hypothetical protein
MKKQDGTEQFLTFEPDEGGWNNIRMGLETVLTIAAAMGRTLVLPPEAGIYLLGEKSNTVQKTTFSLNHFFPMDLIHSEFVGLNIIPMHEFLLKEAMAGNMVDKETGLISFPPNNRTHWDGHSDIKQLYEWLRSVSHMKVFIPEKCLLVFPASHDPKNIVELQDMEKTILQSKPTFESYINQPVPINASTIERMKENWANRKNICIYDREMQDSTFLHLPVETNLRARLLVHFYAFVFYQNWKHDLWMKRYVMPLLLTLLILAPAEKEQGYDNSIIELTGYSHI